MDICTYIHIFALAHIYAYVYICLSAYLFVFVHICAMFIYVRMGTSGGVTISKLDWQAYTSDFESHWAPHSFGLVPHRSKELCKLLYMCVCTYVCT